MRKIQTLVLMLLIIAPTAFAGYQVGDRVNDFTLRDSYGNFVSFSDYPNAIKFLVFWQPG